MTFKSAHLREIVRVPGNKCLVSTARVKSWWLSRTLINLVVPCEIKNRVFVSLAEAQALNLRIEDIPDINKSIVAGAR